MNSSAPARRAALTTSSNVACGLAAVIFSRIVPLNRKFSCRTTPRLRLRWPDVVFAHVDPIDLDETLVVGVQPLEQACHRGLAGSAAADDAERMPDRNLE